MKARFLALLGVGGCILASGAGCGTSQTGPAQGQMQDGGTGGGRDAASDGSTSRGTAPEIDGSSTPGDGSSDASPRTTSSPDGSDRDGSGAGSTGLWVTGYYPSWNDPANDGTYPVTAIDWDGLSDVASAFYIPDGHGGWASGSFDQTTAKAVIAAAHDAGKKAIASVGGSNSGATFEQSVETAKTTFLANLGALLTLGYDGIDVDWENGTGANDDADQIALVEGLRSAHPTTLLTITAGSINENIQPDLTVYSTVASQVDRINVMTYGMSGAYEGWDSWHSSPLHWNHGSSTPAGIDASIGHYLDAGIPAAKLGVGIGFYGECYTSPVTGPAQALGASTVAAGDGVMTYANILANYDSTAAYHYDANAGVPYLTLNGSNAEKCTYVTYEDATSIAAKAAWVKEKGLGGVIIWSIDEGFVSGGADTAAQNPLLEVTRASFLQ